MVAGSSEVTIARVVEILKNNSDSKIEFNKQKFKRIFSELEGLKITEAEVQVIMYCMEPEKHVD